VMATELEIRMRLAEQRQALEDVMPAPYVPVGYANASARHQRLFADFVPALQSAKAEADAWWQQLIDTEFAAIGDLKEAITNVEMRRPAGSVVHGGVIHVFRQAWMSCVALNQAGTHPSGASVPRVEPFELVLSWLLEHQHFDLVEFLGRLPYLPVGIDSHGDWL